MSLIKRVNFKLRHLSAWNLSLINLYVIILLYFILFGFNREIFQHFCHSVQFSSVAMALLFTAFAHAICYCCKVCEREYETQKSHEKHANGLSIWLRVFLISLSVCVCVCLCKRFHYSLFTGVISEIFRKRMEKYTHTHAQCQVVNENCIACRSGSWMFNVQCALCECV